MFGINSFHNKKGGATQRALNNDECVICFDPLSSYPTVNLRDQNGKQSCRHHFHKKCIEAIRPPLNCPCCRTPFASTSVEPSLSVDPQVWFRFLDSDNSGSLSYDEIIDGLKPQLVLDWRRIEMEMDNNWRKWDKDGNGSITFEEFADPQNGLLAFLRTYYPATPRPPPPNLIDNKSAWFDYWDEDHSGALEKAEVVRALTKTFNLYHIPTKNLRDNLDNIWCIFDERDTGSIDRQTFLATDNLADTIVAQFAMEARKK